MPRGYEIQSAHTQNAPAIPALKLLLLQSISVRYIYAFCSFYPLDWLVWPSIGPDPPLPRIDTKLQWRNGSVGCNFWHSLHKNPHARAPTEVSMAQKLAQIKKRTDKKNITTRGIDECENLEYFGCRSWTIVIWKMQTRNGPAEVEVLW